MKLPEFRKWTPKELRAFIRSGEPATFGAAEQSLLSRLATDERMREFWSWLDIANDEAEAAGTGYELDPIQLFHIIVRGVRLPEKPGDMTPKARERYLSEVREHARQLVRLLEGTRFDGAVVEWPKEELALLTDYPACTLTSQLQDLVDWTNKPDRHDAHARPAWMIRHRGSASKAYLMAVLLDEFEFFGRIPSWELMAALMNVTLDLCGAGEINSDAVQKMVARIRERRDHVKDSAASGREYSLADLLIESFRES